MTYDQIQEALAESMGRPVSGAIHDAIPAMAAAIDRALNGEKPGATSSAPISGKTTRVIEAPETR